jgi:hypothetical protein
MTRNKINKIHGEIVGIGFDGKLLCWNARKRESYGSGMTADEYQKTGVISTKEQELIDDVGHIYSECGNCEMRWTDDELEDVDDLGDRMSPGDTYPSGQCPACHSLCTPVYGNKRAERDKLRHLLADAEKVMGSLAVQLSSHMGSESGLYEVLGKVRQGLGIHQDDVYAVLIDTTKEYAAELLDRRRILSVEDVFVYTLPEDESRVELTYVDSKIRFAAPVGELSKGSAYREVCEANFETDEEGDDQPNVLIMAKWEIDALPERRRCLLGQFCNKEAAKGMAKAAFPATH